MARVKGRGMSEKIEERFPLESGSALRIEADGVRRERTGVHAKVSLYQDTVLLAFSQFNVERDEERGRLARSAHAGLGEIDAAGMPLIDLKHALDLFCSTLWERHIGATQVEVLAPVATYARRFLLRPYVLSGGGVILFGPPGRGKSYISLAMAVALDAGVDDLFAIPQPARAMYVNLERSPESMAKRLHEVNRAMRLDPDRGLLFVNARGKGLSDIAEAIRRAVAEWGVEFVVLDSLSRAGGGDLNENQTANRVIDMLNSSCPSWLAIGHAPRADASHLFGSVHFDAGADVVISLKSAAHDDMITVGLEVTKANDIRKPPIRAFSLVFDEDGLIDIERSDGLALEELNKLLALKKRLGAKHE